MIKQVIISGLGRKSLLKKRTKNNWINSSTSNHSNSSGGSASLPFPINPLLNPQARKNMLKKPNPKTSSQSQIKQAYDLVAKDLFSTLKKAKNGAVIKFGNCGTFEKKIARVTNPYGDTYRYYRISFKVSNQLKKELD